MFKLTILYCILQTYWKVDFMKCSYSKKKDGGGNFGRWWLLMYLVVVTVSWLYTCHQSYCAKYIKYINPHILVDKQSSINLQLTKKCWRKWTMTKCSIMQLFNIFQYTNISLILIQEPQIFTYYNLLRGLPPTGLAAL